MWLIGSIFGTMLLLQAVYMCYAECEKHPSNVSVHQKADTTGTTVECHNLIPSWMDPKPLCPNVSVTWYKDNDVVQDEDGLILIDLQTEDEGFYECQVGAVRSQRHKVLVPPRLFVGRKYKMRPSESKTIELFTIGPQRLAMNYTIQVSHRNNSPAGTFSVATLNRTHTSSNKSTFFSNISISVRDSMLVLKLTRKGSINTGATVPIEFVLKSGTEDYSGNTSIQFLCAEERSELSLDLELTFNGPNCHEFDENVLLQGVQTHLSTLSPCYSVTLSANLSGCDDTPVLGITVHFPLSVDPTVIMQELCGSEIWNGVSITNVTESPTTNTTPTTNPTATTEGPHPPFGPWKITCVVGIPVLLVIIVAGGCVWVIRSHSQRNRDRGCNGQPPVHRRNAAVVQPLGLQNGPPYRHGNQYIDHSPMVPASPANPCDLTVAEFDNSDADPLSSSIHLPHYLVVPQPLPNEFHRPATNAPSPSNTTRVSMQHCPLPHVPYQPPRPAASPNNCYDVIQPSHAAEHT